MCKRLRSVRDQANDGRPLTIKVRRLRPSENEIADVVAEPRPELRYGYIISVDEERWGSEVRQHIRIECTLASWFDERYALKNNDADEVPFGAVDENAIAAEMLDIELVVSEDLLADMNDHLKEWNLEDVGGRGTLPHMHECNWVGVYLTADLGLPVAVYRPAEGSNDPASIGTTPNMTSAFAVLVRLGTPKLRELRWYSDVYGMN